MARSLLDRSWIRTPDDVVDFVTSLFDARGGGTYEEDISQYAHALQCAALAEADGAARPLVVAALLHDIGHLVMTDADPEQDAHHERIAASMLSPWFGPDIVEPVALHVAAKRYLVTTDPSYLAGLSLASLGSLELQGGPMSPDERVEFEALPYFSDACRLRRWDDLAKDVDAVTPAWSHYAPMMRDLVAL